MRRRLLEDVGPDAEAAVRAEAERLAVPLGDVRLTARTRGRTWLEDEPAGRGPARRAVRGAKWARGQGM
ncbi:hypothetical protein ABZ784_34265 [Streptomyces tendae]|uniref:hypothetical protein n=1 Tax=Streptomyces TaxID=1883 RepID=UPI002FDBBFED